MLMLSQNLENSGTLCYGQFYQKFNLEIPNIK